MANATVSFSQGLSSNLPASDKVIPGTFYLTTDTGELYLGTDAKSLLKIKDTNTVIKNGTGVQTIGGGLNIGGTPNKSEGAGRIILTGVTNPLIGIQAVDSTGAQLTLYYLQVHQNKLFLGASSDTATSIDEDGNMTIKGDTVNIKATKGLSWAAKKTGTTPYIGHCTASTDGTFVVGSILGTTYKNGLSIGGTSGNLLWKEKRVLTVDDLVGNASTSAAGLMSATDKSKLDSLKQVSFTQSLTSGTEIGKLTIDKTTYTLYSQTNTDYLVKQTPSTSSLEHPLLASSTGAGGASSALTTETIFAAGITINPNTNTITATNFAGTATAANSFTIGTINTGENLNNYFEQNHFKLYNAPALTTDKGMPISSALLGDGIAVQSYPLSTTKQIQEVVDAEGKMHVRVKDNVANNISDWRIMCSIKEGIAVGNETTPVYIKADGTPEPVNIDVDVFIVQNTKPSNHKKLWIDTTAKTGGLKYYSEELQDWTHVPVAWV